MGTGVGDNSGAMPAITPDMLPPEDDSVAAMAQRNLELAEATLKALAEEGPQGDSLRVHLARQWQEAAVKCYEAVTFYRAGRADEREAMLQPAPGPGKHRSPRKPRPNPGQLRLLGLLPAPLAAWAAKHAVTVKASAAVIAAVSVPAGALVIHAALAAPAHSSPAFGTGTPAPAASIEGAFPIGVPPFIARVTKPGLDAKSSRKDDPDSVLTPALPSSAPGTSGASSPGSSSAPSSPAPAGPAEGRLIVPAAAAGITVSDPTQAVTIELDASDAGNVPWGLTCTTDPGSPSGCADITFSATDGSIPAGQSATVGLTFDAAAQAAGGSVTLTFGPGNKTVTVTWQAVAASPSPSPSGT